ncbi:MAG TPA: SRPBCC family protein [Methylophaga aminisulfidivorans]|uniref:SRPBCC family protein n=1 Tax=Methylophaga aminisulfidivorans TaxID=230105 RepID=A0A7C1VQY7_9GAMM|nr:SRPBCC family protein [Methylophaga aminisulfidivorans]
MKQLFNAMIVFMALMPALVAAHGAPRLKVEEKIIIKADPDTVWNAVKDFDNAHSWIPAIEKTVAKGGNEKGATRTLTLRGGATVSEKLKKFDDKKMSYMYEITDISSTGEIDDHGEMHEVPAFPVSKYKSWVSVKAVDGGAQVIWLGKFFRAYHGNGHPPKALDDNTAIDAVTGLYKSSLENLRTMLEK